MAHEIMIPSAENLPAYIINKDLARQLNAEAGEGISSGAVPRLRVVGKGTFSYKDGDEEVIIKPGQMVTGSDEQLYLKSVILRAKGPLGRAFYVDPYDKDAESKAPDCFSNDGLRPDASISTPQCDVCASCPQAAYGSALKGGGQACTQTKTLAVLLPKSPSNIYKVKVTPKALRNWKSYVKRLDAAGIPLRYVFTLIGFMPAETYPVLTFEYGGPIPQEAMVKIDALAESQEVLEIIEDKMVVSAPKAPATTPAKPATKPAEKKPDPKPEAAKEETVDDMFAEPEKPAEKAAAPAKEQEKAIEALDVDDIAAELGL